jgi:hypothetical protein
MQSNESQKRQRDRIGHGQLVISGETAIQAIGVLDRKIAMLLNEEPRDFETLLELMRLKADFNRQLLESGKAHLRDNSEPFS